MLIKKLNILKKYARKLRIKLLGYFTTSRVVLYHELHGLLRSFFPPGDGELVIFDIGANIGEWTKEMRTVLPHARFYMFEANKRHEEALRETGHPYKIAALAAPDQKEAYFYSSEKRFCTGASIYKDKSKTYEDVDGIKIDLQTLDDVASEFGNPKPHLIKIDTQGSEIDILKGAAKTLERTEFILLEVPVIECNTGAPNFVEYVTYLKDINFLPIRLTDYHCNGNVLVQIDILFAHKASSKIDWTKSKIPL